MAEVVTCSFHLTQYQVLFSGVSCFFFLSGFSLTDTDNSQDSKGREGTFTIDM